MNAGIGWAGTGKTGDQPDAVLVEGARRGEARAFEGLVRRHIRAAHGLAVSIVKSSDLADDVCQDAFVSALQHIEQCRHPERFKGWFLSIVRNRALNVRASEALRSGVDLDRSGPVIADESPYLDLERREVMAVISDATEHLSGLNRDVFILHDVEGLSHAEVSENLGISRISSRVHLHHARLQLRTMLDHHPITEV